MLDERFKERCNKDLERRLHKDIQRYGGRLYVETGDRQVTYTVMLGLYSIKHHRDLAAEDNLYPTKNTYCMRVEMLHDDIMRAVYGMWTRHKERIACIRKEQLAAKALLINQEIEGGLDYEK